MGTPEVYVWSLNPHFNGGDLDLPLFVRPSKEEVQRTIISNGTFCSFCSLLRHLIFILGYKKIILGILNTLPPLWRVCNTSTGV